MTYKGSNNYDVMKNLECLLWLVEGVAPTKYYANDSYVFKSAQ